MRDRAEALERAAAHARNFLDGLDERPVAAPVEPAALRDTLGGSLPDEGEDPRAVIDALVAGVEPGLVATAGPRYFGFVIGGALPAALAADWLVSAWDQNAGMHVMSPAAAAIEEATAGWVLNLLGLPPSASIGFVTGAQGANTTALAAARHAVLGRAGWDVERDGLNGAPRVNVLCGEQAHVTIAAALRLLGLGAGTAIAVEADEQGRMRPERLEELIAPLDGPTIVCAQAGNVNTGAFDPFGPIADVCANRGAWLHVDGAFGLWAGASASTRPLVDGVERAHSWAVDAHKWLNVPYDAALAIVADPTVHAASMSIAASYLQLAHGEARRDRLRAGGLAALAGDPRVCGAALARPAGVGRPGRAQLRAGQADGRATGGGSRVRDPQRRRPQPGARALPRWRRGEPGGDRGDPARWHLLARRDRVARPARGADLILELVDHGRRRRPLGRGDRRRCSGLGLTRLRRARDPTLLELHPLRGREQLDGELHPRPDRQREQGRGDPDRPAEDEAEREHRALDEHPVA